MLKTLIVEINVDEIGTGSAVTDDITGYIKLIALPKRTLYNTIVQIRPQQTPDLMFQVHMKEDEKVFRIKMPTTDMFGNLTPEMADLPVKGPVEVGVGGAVPDSIFRVHILYDTVE